MHTEGSGRGIFIKGAGRTDPNANADNHGHSRSAMAERFQRVDCDVTAVAAHGCQSDAGGLDRHLGNTYILIYILTLCSLKVYTFREND